MIRIWWMSLQNSPLLLCKMTREAIPEFLDPLELVEKRGHAAVLEVYNLVEATRNLSSGYREEDP